MATNTRTDMFIGRDVEALVVERLRNHFGDSVEFIATELPSITPDRVPRRGLWLWRAGGYTSRAAFNAVEHAQFMVHAVGSNAPETAILCAETLAVLSSGHDVLGVGRGLSGPYSNPLPDHPYLYRYTVQVEVPVYNRVVDIQGG